MKPNETLLIIRQSLIKVYKQYEYIIMPLIKFMVVFSIITMMGSSVGYIGILNKIEVVLFFSLVGTFLPDKWMILGIVILMPLYIGLVNPVLGLLAFLFLWILYLLFMRLFPKESILIVITIVAFNIGFETLLPVLAALFGNYVCIIAIIIGIFIRFVMPQFAQIVGPHALQKDEMMEFFTNLAGSNFKDIITDKTMLSVIVVFFIVFSIVYIIRKQSVDYAPYLAIVTGLVMNLAGFILAKVFLDINMSIMQILVNTIFAAVISFIVQFFSRVLDYQRAEVVSFEDEENYYYVKVVPKVYITSSHKKVKRVYNTKVDHREYMNNVLNSPSIKDDNMDQDE